MSVRKDLKLACCNFIPDPAALRGFALEHRFDGVEWTFTLDTLPAGPAEEASLLKTISTLHPLEVRYHCAFVKTDLGHGDEEEARKALTVFRKVCRVVSKLGGRHVTIHVGLGQESTDILSWERTVESLAALTQFAGNLGVRVCLENLGWGWTSRPQLYEKLIRRSGAWATLDIGHARVSPFITSHHFDLHDFVTPQADRFLGAHIYHEEREDSHIPPAGAADIEERLRLLQGMPLCDWWVLEIREEAPLLETLAAVRAFLDGEAARAGESAAGSRR